MPILVTRPRGAFPPGEHTVGINVLLQDLMNVTQVSNFAHGYLFGAVLNTPESVRIRRRPEAAQLGV